MFQDIQQLNRAILLILQRSAVDDVLQAEVLFGVTPEIAELIKSLSLEDIDSISKVSLPLAQLRNPQDKAFWDQLISVVKDNLDPDGEILELATALRLADQPKEEG